MRGQGLAAPRLPKAVLFDLWGTLITSDRFDTARGNARMLQLAGSSAPLEDVLRFEHAILRDRERREDEAWMEFTRQALQRLINDRFALRPTLDPQEQEWEFWSHSLEIRLTDGVAAALDGVRARGIRAGVVSNSSFTAATIQRTLAGFGVADRFDAVVSSADYLVRKPHRAIFDAALARIGVAAAEAWFAGDHVEYDLRGGIGAGIFVVLYRPPVDPPPKLSGYRRIECWRELATLLDEAV